MRQLINPVFLIRAIICTIIAYVCMEAWARHRFDLNNRIIPSYLRANMGINTYEAFRLKPGFSGYSATGIHYQTDNLGYRSGQRPFHSPNSLILAGDSRTFGLGLPFEKSLPTYLQNSLGDKVFLQAVPGGSPAFTRHDVFTTGRIASMQPKPKTLIYLYDLHDIFNDRIFMDDINLELPWYSSRKIKLALGGYLWNMLNIKYRSFKQRSQEPEVVEPAEAKTPSKPAPSSSKTQKPKAPKRQAWDIGFTTEILVDIHRLCRENGMTFYLLYLPRMGEILDRDPVWNQQFKDFAQKHDIPFIDAFVAIDKLTQGHFNAVEKIFLDPSEGIHYSSHGHEVVSKVIAEHLRTSR